MQLNYAMDSIIAIGFTGNYAERNRLKEYYAELVKRGYPVTFFHPLRTATWPVRADALENDMARFLKRFEALVSSLPAGAHVRVVLHTEYGVPLWCDGEFQDAYAHYVPRILRRVDDMAQGYKLLTEPVVELHPGFTALVNCSKTRKHLYCKSVERDVEKLAQCVSQLREKFCKLGVNPLLYIEPRAGSAIYLEGRTAPQTLPTHEAAYTFAKRLGLKLVVDVGQTVLKRVSMEEAWTEVFRVVSADPNAVGEVHVHSPTARRGHGHGIPTSDELERFKELVRTAARGRDRPLGVVLEVMNARIDDLIYMSEVLLGYQR